MASESADGKREHRGVDWLVGRWWFWAILFVALVGLPLAKSISRARALPPIGPTTPRLTLTDENGRAWSTSELADRPYIACWLDDDRGMWRRLPEIAARLKHVPPDRYHLVALSSSTDIERLAGEFHLAALDRNVDANAPRPARLGSGATAHLLFGGDPHNDNGGCILVDNLGRQRGRYEISRPEAMTDLVAHFAQLVPAQ